MKTLKWSLLVVLVTGVGVLTVMLHTRSPRSLATDAGEVTDANEQNRPGAYHSALSATAPFRKLARAFQITPERTDVPAADIALQPANTVQVRADRVLAKVNDRVILLKELVPLRPDEQDQAMTSEEYESRLGRAIEMELTFQVAATRGVGLTPEQTKRVDGIAQRHEAAFREYAKQGVTWSSVNLGQVEFEQRLTSALMLQQNLIARDADVAPSADSSIQTRYELARTEVLNRLKASSTVSVSIAEL